jgi:hypothetical protein
MTDHLVWAAWLHLAHASPTVPEVWETQDGYAPACRLIGEIPVAAGRVGVVGVAPSVMVDAFTGRRTGCLRWGNDQECTRAVLTGTFEPVGSPLEGVTHPRPVHDAFLEPEVPGCTVATPAVVVEGTWSIRIRARHHRVAVGTILVRSVMVGPGAGDWYIHTPGSNSPPIITVPRWAWASLEIDALQPQRLVSRGTWSELGVSSFVGQSREPWWTFEAAAPEELQAVRLRGS